MFGVRKEHYGYLFIAPFIIGFLVFGLYPVYNTIYLSFTDTTMMTREASWIGMQNFQRLFADDGFITAVKNTWIISVGILTSTTMVAALLSDLLVLPAGCDGPVCEGLSPAMVQGFAESLAAVGASF